MSETKNENRYEHIEALVEKLRANTDFKPGDAKKDVIKIDVDDKLFESTLPEGLSLKHVKEVQSHIRNVATALMQIAGEESIDVFKKNNDVNTVALSVNAGHQKINAVSKRTHVTRNPSTGEETTHHGFVSVHAPLSVPAGSITYVRSKVGAAFAKAGLGK